MMVKIIISWSLIVLPIVASAIYGVSTSESKIIIFVIPWGLLGVSFKATFDYIFKLPMRVAYSGTIECSDKNKFIRLILLCLAIVMGIVGFIILMHK